jgi:hypothetical protein
MTKQQRDALNRLRAMRDAGELHVSVSASGHAYISTGIHTTVLARLRRAGLITCSDVYLHGKTSADLTVK